MNINTIIENKYKEFAKYNDKNVIREIEIQNEQLSDIEDEDLMHSIMLRLLKKYKDVEFDNLELGFEIVKNDYFKIRHFAKRQQKHQLNFVELLIMPDED